MRVRFGVASLVVALATAPALSLAATAHPAKAKKCYAKKHGKRVRVTCKKKLPPRPAPQPHPVVDPKLTADVTTLLTNHMLHRFSTSASHIELLLHTCPGGSYQYVDFADQSGTSSGNGTWRVTGAESTPPGITAGLLLLPAGDGAPRLLILRVIDNGDGSYTVTVNGDRWYLSPSTLCPPPA
jgi:hypothetical protein